MSNKDITKYKKEELEELIEAFAAQGVVNSATEDVVSLEDFANNSQRIEFVQAAIAEYGDPLAEDDGTESAEEAENRAESDENSDDGAEDDSDESDQSEGLQAPTAQVEGDERDTVPGTGRGEEIEPEIKEYKGEKVLAARNKVLNGKLYVEIDTRNTVKLLSVEEYKQLGGNRTAEQSS